MAMKGVKRNYDAGGSRKGIPNRLTKELKDMILGALEDVGGQQYLRTQAIENPTAFLTLIGKVLPKDINVSGEMELKNMTDEELDARLMALREAIK